MDRKIQWNCKGLRARHEEIQLLMNKVQHNCICLHEVMLEKKGNILPKTKEMKHKESKLNTVPEKKHNKTKLQDQESYQ